MEENCTSVHMSDTLLSAARIATRRGPPAALAAALLAAILAVPLAAADHDDATLDEITCGVTPGGWGAQPAGNNPGQLLHDNFDDVFGARLTVGSLVFEDAQAVTDAMPYNGVGSAFKSHAVALSINIAFGNAGLLDATVAGQTAESDDPALDGKTAEEILAMAENVLRTDSDIKNNEYSSLIDAMTGFNEEAFGCNAPPPCPANVVAIPQDNGSIRLTWSAVAGAEEYHVYRATGSGALMHLATVKTTTYTDATTAVGQAYSYMVTADDGVLESRGCSAVIATAVPFFGGALLTAIAAVGALGAFVVLRRRA